MNIRLRGVPARILYRYNIVGRIPTHLPFALEPRPNPRLPLFGLCADAIGGLGVLLFATF